MSSTVGAAWVKTRRGFSGDLTLGDGEDPIGGSEPANGLVYEIGSQGHDGLLQRRCHAPTPSERLGT